MFLLNGRMRDEAPVASDVAKADTIEVWNFVNLAGDSHPMHLHMSDMQVLGRQAIRDVDYMAALMAYRDGLGPEPQLADYLVGNPLPLPGRERGASKDTVQAPAAQVTTVAVKFGPDTGESVWHCHVLEHEDNDMMRPLIVEP